MLAILWCNMTHDVIQMSVEQSGSELFCEVISHIYFGVYSRKKDEILLHPFTDNMVFNIQMSGSWCWFCAFAMARHASLSLYRSVAAACGTPKSHNTLQTKSIIRPAEHAAINSPSVDD